MKLKRGDINIAIMSREGRTTVEGMVGDTFGYHRSDDSGGRYTVDHLRTGYKVCGFIKAREARNFVIRAEQAVWPVNWDNASVQELSGNGDKVFKIKQRVLGKG